MTAVQARTRNAEIVGQWRVYVMPPGGTPIEVTYVRGAPTAMGEFSDSDPFGPETGSLTFGKITIFDRLGTGDLAWCLEGADVDLVWDGPVPAGYPDGGFRWQGHFLSFDWSSEGLTVAVRGAMRQLDDFLAKPEYPGRPLTYEWAISRQLDSKPSLRLGRLRVEWPSWWSEKFIGTDQRFSQPYMRPMGVVPGENWTGLLTRQTGSWDPVLSGYVTQLLQAMYTSRGRFALDLAPGRNPVLRHRDFKTERDASTLTIDPAAPGVEVSLSKDWSQSLNAVFGQGTSLAGLAYSGQQPSIDGRTTNYEPLAAMRQVHPLADKNGWLEKSRMRKEVNLQLQAGLDLVDAQKVAASHLARFADPGFTGSITLTSDPVMGSTVLPRLLVQSGMSVYVRRAFGTGLLLHITKVSRDFAGGTITLTVDSKYRDSLTVDEVRLRGRDALSITRSLIGGQYQPPVPDQLVPWDDAQGSGYLPSPAQSGGAKRLFDGAPNNLLFPWVDWTTLRPPKDPSWRNCYVRIGPTSSNANDNWAARADKDGARYGIPMRLGQAGTVRMVQVAAFDRNGNVMPVPFHVSFYYSVGVNHQSMPVMPAALQSTNTPYLSGQHYPFFENAWETYNLDGTRLNPQTPVATETSGLVRAYGTRYEKAGYWPGSSAAGDAPTGKLIDETQWGWDTTSQGANVFDPYSPDKNQVNPLSGTLYAMIYCDAQGVDEVFFLGRLFRVEPGVSV